MVVPMEIVQKIRQTVNKELGKQLIRTRVVSRSRTETRISRSCCKAYTKMTPVIFAHLQLAPVGIVSMSKTAANIHIYILILAPLLGEKKNRK
jgi:hypothetical protein